MLNKSGDGFYITVTPEQREEMIKILSDLYNEVGGTTGVNIPEKLDAIFEVASKYAWHLDSFKSKIAMTHYLDYDDDVMYNYVVEAEVKEDGFKLVLYDKYSSNKTKLGCIYRIKSRKTTPGDSGLDSWKRSDRHN